jgi:hypothetical protein
VIEQLKEELVKKTAESDERLRLQKHAEETLEARKKEYAEKLVQQQQVNAKLEERTKRDLQDLQDRLAAAATKSSNADTSCSNLSVALKRNIDERAKLNHENQDLAATYPAKATTRANAGKA